MYIGLTPIPRPLSFFKKQLTLPGSGRVLWNRGDVIQSLNFFSPSHHRPQSWGSYYDINLVNRGGPFASSLEPASGGPPRLVDWTVTRWRSLASREKMGLGLSATAPSAAGLKKKKKEFFNKQMLWLFSLFDSWNRAHAKSGLWNFTRKSKMKPVT